MTLAAQVGLSICSLAMISGEAQAKEDGAVNVLTRDLGPLQVQEVHVEAADGVIPKLNDDQSFAYVERRMTPPEKQAFRSWLGTRSFDRVQAGERITEYLTQANLRDRLTITSAASRPVLLTLRVDRSDFPVMRIPLTPPMPIKQASLGASFTLLDATSEAVLAHGRIDNIYGLVSDGGEAAKRTALRYQNFGRDDHFQVLTGLTNAVSRTVDGLIEEASLPMGHIRGERTNVGIGIPISVVDSAPAPTIQINLGTAALGSSAR